MQLLLPWYYVGSTLVPSWNIFVLDWYPWPYTGTSGVLVPVMQDQYNSLSLTAPEWVLMWLGFGRHLVQPAPFATQPMR